MDDVLNIIGVPVAVQVGEVCKCQPTKKSMAKSREGNPTFLNPYCYVDGTLTVSVIKMTFVSINFINCVCSYLHATDVKHILVGKSYKNMTTR